MISQLKKQNGYALFDALYGALILALAVFIAALATQYGQQQADNAWYSQQALIIAENVANKIRMNSNNMTSFGADYTNNNLWEQTSQTCLRQCTATEQMYQDGFETAQMVSRLLPDGGVTVSRCNNHLCIFVWWFGEQPINANCSQNCILLEIVS